MRTKIGRLQSVGLLVLILLLAACGPTVTPIQPSNTPEPTGTPLPTVSPRTPVIIDTDMSMDAIMAILYILQAPEVDVKAITVAGTGEAHCGPGIAHALGLIDMVNATGIAVACGRETPFEGDSHFPSEFRKNADSDLGISWPKVSQTEVEQSSKLSAVDLIKSTIQSSSQPVVMVTDGPLTNLGEALQSNPDLVGKIKMVYIMGGAIDVPGNLYGVPLSAPNKTAEFNIFVDPHAAGIVVNSGVPVTLVPLDVTNQVPLDWVFYKLINEHQTTQAAKAVYDMLTSTQAYKQGIYFWDPLTYSIAVDNSLATYSTKKITIVEEEGAEIGRTKVSDAGKEVRVAMTTTPEIFMEQYLKTLNGGADITIDWVAAEATPTLPANVLQVTFSAGKCTVTGSMQVNGSEVGVMLINREPEKWAGIVVATLDDGKTIADLEAWPSTDQPPWLQIVDTIEAVAGKDSQKVETLNDKPLYLVCFEQSPLAFAGRFGPIERKK